MSSSPRKPTGSVIPRARVNKIRFATPLPEEPSFWDKIQFPLRWMGLSTLVAIALYGFRYLQLDAWVTSLKLPLLALPYGIWGPLILAGLYIPMMLLMVIPFGLMAGLSVLLLGVTWGITTAVIGGTLGATAVFLASRWIGSGLKKDQPPSPRMLLMNQRLENEGFFYLLLLRTVSIVPYNLLNTISGLTELRVRDFVLANLIGLIPSAIIYGYGIKLLCAPKSSPLSLGLLMAVIILLILPPFVFKQYKQVKQKKSKF